MRSKHAIENFKNLYGGSYGRDFVLRYLSDLSTLVGDEMLVNRDGNIDQWDPEQVDGSNQHKIGSGGKNEVCNKGGRQGNKKTVQEDISHTQCCCSRSTIILILIFCSIGAVGMGVLGMHLYKSNKFPPWVILLLGADRDPYQQEDERSPFVPSVPYAFFTTETLMPSIPPTTRPSFKPTPIPSSCDLSEDGHPNLDQVSFSVNALFGRTPTEQYMKFHGGSKMFDFTNCVVSEIETVDIGGCETIEQTSDYWWSTSRSALQQAHFSRNEVSNGFELNLDISVPVKGVMDISVAKKMQNSLGSSNGFRCFWSVIGNSETSNKLFSERDEGFSHSFSAFGTRHLYTVQVDFDDISTFDTWTDEFKTACSDLGDDPTDSMLLKFFDEHGTHGLATAEFGQRCTQTVFMKNGKRSNDYNFLKEKAGSFEENKWGNLESNEENFTSEIKDSVESGFEWKVSHQKCLGELKGDSPCVEGKKDSGKDEPSIIQWTYKPIWEMNVPGFTESAKKNMKQFLEDIMDAAVQCAIENCSGRGSCVIGYNNWIHTLAVDFTSLDGIFNDERCICFGDAEGDNCDRKPDSRLITKPWGPYINTFKKDFNYKASKGAIAGIYSLYSNANDDRLFRFKEVKPEGFDGIDLEGGRDIIDTLDAGFDGESIAECNTDDNMVLVGINSNVITRVEKIPGTQSPFLLFGTTTEEKTLFDRTWSYECASFKGWKTYDCDNEWSSMHPSVTQENKKFVFTCPSKDEYDTHVITGMKSTKNVRPHDDRIFRFKCCRLSKEFDDTPPFST